MLIAPSPLESRGENLLLTLRALPEARLADELGSAGNYAVLQIDEYMDDRGQSLLPSGQPLVFAETPIDRSNDAERLWKWKIEALLPRPAAGRRIGSLKGRFGVSVGPPQTEIAAVDLTRGTGELFEFDGVGVRVTSVVPSELTYTVTGEIFAPTNSPMGRTLLTRHPDNYLGLRDKTGAGLWRDTGPANVRSEAGVTTMTWTLRGRALRQADGISRSGPVPGGTIVQCTANCVPTALVWVTPTDTHWIQTPFDLRGIPLPAPGR